jgi:hypothetical protein
MKHLDKIISELLKVPTIAEAIRNEEYTEKQAIEEFSVQILSGDISGGLFYIEDIPMNLNEDILIFMLSRLL